MHPRQAPLKPMTTDSAKSPAAQTVADTPACLIVDGPSDAKCRLLLAHGAGQGPDSPFMEHVAHALAESGVSVVRFCFPYMEKLRHDARRRPPDRAAVLIERFRAVITDQSQDAKRLFIGGKSMGGRIASMIADQEKVDGVVCLGYPFHPPGKPQQLRIEHLAALRTPMLICQGEHDPFGHRDEVASYRFSPAIELAWLADGEHSFKPRKASGRLWQDNLDLAADRVAKFIADVAR